MIKTECPCVDIKNKDILAQVSSNNSRYRKSEKPLDNLTLLKLIARSTWGVWRSTSVAWNRHVGDRHSHIGGRHRHVGERHRHVGDGHRVR